MNNPCFYRIVTTPTGRMVLQEALENGKNADVTFYLTGDYDHFPSCYVPMRVNVVLKEITYGDNSESAFNFTGLEPEKNKQFYGFFDYKNSRGWLEFKGE